MESNTMATSITREMRELRTPLGGLVPYVSGCGNAGRAIWLNISRTGAAVRLGRYLRPGHIVQLQPLDEESGESWSIAARIAWCERIPGTLQFRAGLEVDRSCPETALRFAALGYAARALNRNTNRTVLTAGWSPDAAAPALSNAGRTEWVRAV